MVNLDVPVLDKGKLLVNYPRAISEVVSALKSFPVKNILYSSVFRGRGISFDSYRRFEQDDDSSMIDWKASLRSNSLLTRKYIEERDLNVYFLVDVSNSMLFGSRKKLKAEFAAELVVALAHLVISSGERVGLVMFGEGAVKVLHPTVGKNQFALIAKFLADSEFYGGDFDMNASIEHVLRTVKSAYTVFVLVSDFISMDESMRRNVRLLGTRFETLAIMLRDPLDENLPRTNYQFAIQHPYSGKQMILDPEIAAEKYRHGVVRRKRMIKEIFKESRIDVLELMVDKPFAIPMTSFFRARTSGRTH